MSKEKALLKDTFIYGIGNFGSRLLGFLLLPLYTLVLSKSDYGYIDLIVTGSTLFLTAISLKLFDGIYRFLWDVQDQEERSVLISSVLNLVLVNFFVFTVILWVVIELKQYEFLYGGMIIFWLLIRTVGEFIQQVSRALGKNYVYSVSGIILSSSMFITNIIFLWFYKLGIKGFIWSMIISYGLSLIYLGWTAQIKGFYSPFKFSKKLIWPLLIYSLPLLPSAISWWFIRVSGRYVLSFFHGLDPVGIYAVSDKIPSVLYMVSLTFYMAWQDNVLKHDKSGDKDQFISNSLNNYLKIGFSVIVLISALLKIFFHIMVKGDYQEAHVYIPCLLLASLMICFAGLYDVFFMSSKKTGGIFYSSLIAAVINVLLNIILVPKYGIWATAITTLIAAVVLWLIRVYQLRQTLKISYDWKSILLYMTLLITSNYIYDLNGWSYFASVLVILISLILLNRTNINSLYKILKQKIIKRG